MFNGGQVNVGFIPLRLLQVTGLGASDTLFHQDPTEALTAELEQLTRTVTSFHMPVLLQSVAGDPAVAYDGDFWAQRSPIDGAAAHPSKVVVPVVPLGASR